MDMCKHFHVDGAMHTPCPHCRVEAFEAENAALKEDNNKLDILYGTEFNRNNDLTVQRNSLLRANLELQHRIKVLREALEIATDHLLVHWTQEEMDTTCPLNKITPALATPDDTSEIAALIKNAERYNKIRKHPAIAPIFGIGIVCDEYIDTMMETKT